MSERKDATEFTEAANRGLLTDLNWDDTQDFEFARRGYIASLDEPRITDADGQMVWDCPLIICKPLKAAGGWTEDAQVHAALPRRSSRAWAYGR